MKSVMIGGALPVLAVAALAPLAPAQRIQLNAPLERVAVGDVLDVRVSADGRFAVYAADLDDSGVARLFRAELERAGVVIDLGASITLSDLSSESLLPRFELAADHVAYLDGPPGPGVALWSVPSDGGASPVRLSPPPVAGGTVTHFRISPDGRSVVYRADQEVGGKFELHAVPVAGGEVVKVSSPLFSGGDVEDD